MVCLPLVDAVHRSIDAVDEHPLDGIRGTCFGVLQARRVPPVWYPEHVVGRHGSRGRSSYPHLDANETGVVEGGDHRGDAAVAAAATPLANADPPDLEIDIVVHGDELLRREAIEAFQARHGLPRVVHEGLRL